MIVRDPVVCTADWVSLLLLHLLHTLLHRLELLLLRSGTLLLGCLGGVEHSFKDVGCHLNVPVLDAIYANVGFALEFQDLLKDVIQCP